MKKSVWLACILMMLPAWGSSGVQTVRVPEVQVVVMPKGKPMHPFKRAVHEEARQSGYPLALYEAAWFQECSLVPVCRNGKPNKAGERGPFQIRAIAAEHAQCGKGWEFGEYNIKCFTKIITQNIDGCGNLPQAFNKYNSGGCGKVGKLSRYALETHITFLEGVLASRTGLPDQWRAR